MRASHLTISVVVISVLVVAVATGPAAAQVDKDKEGTICNGTPGNGDSLVVVLPDDTYVHANDAITLLPGTEADIALCSGGELISTSAWPVDGGSIGAVNVTSTDEYSYAITVENVVERTSVEFGPAIDDRGQVNTPTVTATPGQVTTARIDGDTYRIALDSDQRERFMTANDSYTTTLGEMRSAAERLNGTTGRIAANNTVPDDERIPEINQTRTVRNDYATIQDLLFASAADGNAAAAGALDGYQQYHADTLEETREHLQNANRGIARQARSTALGVLANFLGVLLVGAIVGGVGGRVATNRILAKVEDKRRRSSAVDFRPKHLAGQLFFALLFLSGAVVLLVVVELLGPLLAVLGAVIPL